MIEIDPKPGDFALVRKRDRIGLLLWLAQFADGSEPEDDQYHHVIMYIGDNEIVEAEPGGARKASLDEYNPSDLEWSTGLIDLTPAQRSTICAYAESFVGTPYGWKVYLALAAFRFHIRPSWVINTLSSNSEMICSQLADECYRMAGYRMFPKDLPGSTTPAKLAMFLRQLRAKAA